MSSSSLHPAMHSKDQKDTLRGVMQAKTIFSLLLAAVAVLGSWVARQCLIATPAVPAPPATSPHTQDTGAHHDIEYQRLWGSTWNLTRFKPLLHVTWTNQTSLVKWMQMEVPIVVRGTPAAEWAEQPLEDVLSLHDVMNGTRVQAVDPVFILRAASGKWAPGPGSLDRVLTLPKEEYTTPQLVDVPVQAFLEGGASNASYMYFTTPLEAWQPPLRQRLAAGVVVQEDDTLEPKWEEGPPLPWDQQVWGIFGVSQSDYYTALHNRKDNTNADSSSALAPEPQATLWVSHPNVTAHWHYDCSHNWFVQLSGRKRVLLAPPELHLSLLLFPSVHPSYHQSQLPPDLYGPVLAGNRALHQLEQDSTAAGVPGSIQRLVDGVFAVELQPGSVLYIPPYWFHTVTALDMALSLSVVSPSEEEIVYAKAFWTRVPFGSLTTRRDKTIVVHMYLFELLSKMRALDSPAKFVSSLLKARYRPLYERAGPVAASAGAQAGAGGAVVGADTGVVSAQSGFRFPSCAFPHASKLDVCHRDDPEHTSALKQRHAPAVEALAASMAAVLQDTTIRAGKRMRASVMQVQLSDYVEELALFAVGACNVARFLQACFLET